MDLTGKTVLVVGSGISGVAATELLKKKNVNVVLFDGNKELDLTALREKHPVFADVKIILGELTAEDRSGLVKQGAHGIPQLFQEVVGRAVYTVRAAGTRTAGGNQTF